MPVNDEQYVSIKTAMQRSYAVSELSETTIQAIAISEMDTKHEHINALMEPSALNTAW